MSAAKSRAEQQHQRQKLANSYNELLREFESDELSSVGNYTLGRLIGKGSFGNVYLASHKLTNGSKVVLKSAHKNDPNLAREIHHHRQLIHPHIVRLYEVIVTESLVWLVLEYCSGDELYNYLIKNGRLSETKTQKIFAQLVGAVSYVHQKNCVHRDLKLENILLDKHENVKLCDFGFTREYERLKLLQTFCGTVCYSAPEMVKGEKYLGQAVDVWSLGVILYALLCGELPFDEDDEIETKRMISEREPKYPEHLSQDALSLIKSLLSKKPISRPTLHEVLSHPFLTDFGPGQKNILTVQQPAAFSQQIEKLTLDRMKAAGVDTDLVMEHVLGQRCDSLAGWWTLLVEKEMRKEKRRQRKRSESRRISTASMLAVADFLSPPAEEGESDWQNIGRARPRNVRRGSKTSLPRTPRNSSPGSPLPPPPLFKNSSSYERSSATNLNQPVHLLAITDSHTGESQYGKTTSIRRQGHRKLHFLTSFASLKHWLLESARRAASPTSSSKRSQRLLNGNPSQSSNLGSSSLQNLRVPQPRSRNGSIAPPGSAQERESRTRTRDPPARFANQGNLSAFGMTSIDRKRQSLSPVPLTPHSSYRRQSGRGFSGRKSTSSSLSSVRSFHPTHSKASSIASTASISSTNIKSPRSPRNSLKILPATPNGSSFPSTVRVVRGNGFNETAIFNTGVAFARRKKTPFKGPALNIGGIRSGSPSVGGHGRRNSSGKRSSTGSNLGVPAASTGGGGIIEEEEEGIEDVNEFSPTMGDGVEIEFERYEESDSEALIPDTSAALELDHAVTSPYATLGEEVEELLRGRSKERIATS